MVPPCHAAMHFNIYAVVCCSGFCRRSLCRRLCRRIEVMSHTSVGSHQFDAVCFCYDPGIARAYLLGSTGFQHLHSDSIMHVLDFHGCVCSVHRRGSLCRCPEQMSRTSSLKRMLAHMHTSQQSALATNSSSLFEVKFKLVSCTVSPWVRVFPCCC